MRQNGQAAVFERVFEAVCSTRKDRKNIIQTLPNKKNPRNIGELLIKINTQKLSLFFWTVRALKSNNRLRAERGSEFNFLISRNSEENKGRVLGNVLKLG